MLDTEELLVPNYNGFKYFLPLVRVVKLPIDQLNFVIAQLLGLILGYLLKSKLSPYKTSVNVRQAYCMVFGFAILYYCFGNDCFHIIIVSSISYIFIHQARNIKNFHILMSIFVIAYLSCIHLSRMTEKYHTYTLDITGPLMVMTQKLTNLAFSLHDGVIKNQVQLPTLLQKRAIKKIPSVLEYLSYCFHFQTLMAGPLCFYQDYLDFMTGQNYKKFIQIPILSNKVAQQNGTVSSKSDLKANLIQEDTNIGQTSDLASMETEKIYQISPLRPCFAKTLTCIILGYLLIFIRPLYPVELNYNFSFIYNYSLLRRTFYLYISNALQRVKYYFAWTCADLVCNISGFGFNGFEPCTHTETYDSKENEATTSKNFQDEEKLSHNVPIEPKQRAKWNLITNIDIICFETSISLHSALANWNLSTMAWLRHLVYERVKYQRTLAVYIVSAFWHGFFPGYYVTFISGALFTEAAKMNRRKYRKYFTNNKYVRWIYHAFTFTLTRIIVAYVSMPFVFLKLAPSLILYDSMFYWPHFGALVSVLTYYIIPPKRLPSK